MLTCPMGGGGWQTLHTKCHPIYPFALPIYPPAMGIAAHAQHGAHTRLFVATIGVFLLKGGLEVGPCVNRSEP